MKVQNTLYKLNRKFEPNRPKNAQEYVDGLRSKPETYGKYFLSSYEVDGVTSGALFGHPGMLAELENQLSFAWDGTFKIAPRQFYQVVTFHIFICGKAFPVLLALMEKKSRAHQDAMFRKIKELFPNFKPKWGMADHEKAPRSSAEEIFEGLRGKIILIVSDFIQYLIQCHSFQYTAVGFTTHKQ